MYYLMNKDNIVLTFQLNNNSGMSEDVSFVSVKQEGQTPYGFQDITSWVESRKASKHNAHLKDVMRRLGCDDNEGFIRLTHAVGINDTFWIRNDEENVTWKDVSLYRNQFSEIISRLSFEGAGLYDERFSSTSPELSCEGSFRKCFRKERVKGEFNSDIFLYKRSGEFGEGLEPYCEVLASEIAKIVAPSFASVRYDLCQLHGKLASKCNIFTNENIGYASYSKMNNAKLYTLNDVNRFFEGIGCEQSFRELLVVDSLCFNQDRHSGNYGILFDNDTMEIVGMSPIFDLNLSMLPYVEMPDFENIGDKLYGYAPKLGNDFTGIGQIAMNDVIRDRLKNIADFAFSFRGDEKFTEKRVKCLEKIIRKQAAAILSNETLQTKDVFFSQKAVLTEEKMVQVTEATALMNEFYKRLENIEFKTKGFLSVCEGTEAVQLYFENESYSLVVDFIEKNIHVQQDAHTISIQKLIKNAPDFYIDANVVNSELMTFLKEKGIETFHTLGKEKESELISVNLNQQYKTKLVFEMIRDVGFSVKCSQNGKYAIYDNQDKRYYSDNLSEINEVIDELYQYISEELLDSLAEKAYSANIGNNPLTLEEWQNAFKQHDLRDFINYNKDDCVKVQLLLSRTMTEDIDIKDIADKFDGKDITD